VSTTQTQALPAGLPDSGSGDWQTQLGRHLPLLIGLMLSLIVVGAGAFGFLRARHPDELALQPPQAASAGVASQSRTRLNDASLSKATSAQGTTTNEAPPPSPWPLWEFQLRDPIAPRESALTPPPWRLIGASGVDGKWQLIVLRQGKNEPEYFRVGDKLPGNYRIEAISEEDVTLKHGRRQLVLSYIASR
jgi:hypothetical protein